MKINNKITITGANVVLFVFSMLFIFFQLILGIIAVVLGEGFINSNIYYILLINEFVLILVPVLLYVLFKRLDFKQVFRLNRLRIPEGILIAVISVPAYFVALSLNNIVVYFLQFIGDIPRQPLPVPGNISELIIGLLVIAVSPAICEELLHRGVLLKAYEKRGSMKAVVITAILFGLFHFDVTNLLGPVFLGLLIGYYVVRTNTIFAGMLAHFMSNAIAEFLQYFWRDAPAMNKITVSSGEMISIAAIGLICLIAVWLLVKLFTLLTRGRARLNPPVSGTKNDILSIMSHWPVIVVLSIFLVMNILFVVTLIFTRTGGSIT